MKKITFISLALSFMAIISRINAQTTYCQDIFNNNLNIVNGALFSATTYTGLIGVSFIIIFAILGILALVYAIGRGFELNKLVVFAKTEFIESTANLILIVLIAMGIFLSGAATIFFTSITNLGGQLRAAPPSSPLALFTGICQNTFDHLITPMIFNSIGNLLNLISYEILAGLRITISLSALFPGSSVLEPVPGLGNIVQGLLPTVSFSPWSGFYAVTSASFLEMSTFGTFISFGIALIFLLVIIYFLFPIFLFLGLALRSFPWTRAAGGTFLSLFISFYIVFPALLYPFSAIPPGFDSAYICSPSGRFAIDAACIIATNIDSFVTRAFAFLSTALYFLPVSGGSPGNGFIVNLQIYIDEISVVAQYLIGFGIAFLISFDLLEALGDFLGAPSLQSGRLFEKVL